MAEVIIEKRCSRCQATKPASGFNRSVSKKDGLSSHCKDCCRLYAQTYVRKGNITIACKHCGQDFKTWQYRVARGQIFCSTKCFAANRTVAVHQRFLANLAPAENGCMVWTAGCGRGGYGKFMTAEQKTVSAHRFAWELAHGRPIPNGMFVCHRCDNPPCCNPEHLFLGTNNDNMEDRSNKQRQARGERHGKSKLSDDQIRSIRALHFEGISAAAIARTFGIATTTACQIINYELWKHV